MPYPLRIWTVREQHDNGYTVNCFCWKCKQSRPDVDHQALIDRGLGDKPLPELGLRCACGTRLQFSLQPPSRHESKSLPSQIPV